MSPAAALLETRRRRIDPIRLRLLVAAAGLAFAVGAEITRLGTGWPLSWVVVDAIPGIAFLVLGVAAHARRPDTNIGDLMLATGGAWFVGTWAVSTDPIALLAGGFQGWYDPLLAWLVLTYPTGRLAGRATRLAVGGFLLILTLRTVFRLATSRPSTAYDFGDPVDIERFVVDRTLRDTGEGVFAIAIAIASVVVLALIVRRLMVGSRADRRIAGPVLLGGIALAIAVVVETVAVGTAASFAERAAAWDLGSVLTSASGALVPVGFLVGLARGRFARGAVADLVIELGDAPQRGDLRDLLGRTLGDPSLVVAYPAPDGDRFVDLAGRPVDLPADGTPPPGRAVTRLEAEGRTLAVLVHDPALDEDRDLIRSVAAAARLTLENERLAAEVRSQLVDVRASRARIVEAGDAERRRVERDLHDGAQQRLVTLALLLQSAERTAQQSGSEPALAAQIARAAAELELALGELRVLARGLHPTVLTEEGLTAAVEALADRCPVPVRLNVASPERRYSAAVEAAAWFVVSESLTNVAKYASARAVTVRIEEEVAGQLTVEVGDDGVGGADPDRGSGLRGLDDRIAAVGGRLTIRSNVGAGTLVRAEISCD
jgi:signal transduction histidine kinase